MHAHGEVLAPTAGMTPSIEELERSRIAREEQRERRHHAEDRMHAWRLGLFAAGRIFLGAVFVGSAVGMLADFSGTIASLQETVVDVHDLVPLAIGFQLIAGSAIVLGWFCRPAALAAATYLVSELMLVPPDLSTDLGRAVGFAHLGLLGALAMLAAHGAGRLSLDHVVDHRRRVRAAHKAV
jgi:putative oxidoreductase